MMNHSGAKFNMFIKGTTEGIFHEKRQKNKNNSKENLFF